MRSFPVYAPGNSDVNRWIFIFFFQGSVPKAILPQIQAPGVFPTQWRLSQRRKRRHESQLPGQHFLGPVPWCDHQPDRQCTEQSSKVSRQQDVGQFEGERAAGQGVDEGLEIKELWESARPLEVKQVIRSYSVVIKITFIGGPVNYYYYYSYFYHHNYVFVDSLSVRVWNSGRSWFEGAIGGGSDG